MASYYCACCGAYIPAPYIVTTNAREDLCVECAEIRLNEAEDLLRWRKWPEERPNVRGLYLVMTTGECPEWPIAALHCGAESDTWVVDGNFVTHWRPLGPLPEYLE